MEIEVEEEATAEIPQPATPPGLGEQASANHYEVIPDTPPPPPQAATLTEREKRPRQVVTLAPRLHPDERTFLL